MKLLKRCGMAVLTLAALTVMLTGAALAAEVPAAAPSTISVQLNGQLVNFTDAVPEVVDQRTFLPFRAVLEAMGAEVGYDAATSTVTAHRNGVDLSMTLGEKKAAVTENGQTRTMEMDVAAYAKNNRTYVPVRFAAEAFGCSVGWDQANQTVIIADVDALFGDATFTLMDRFAAYSAKQENQSNLAMTGNLALDMEDKTGTVTAQPVHMTGTMTGITGEKGIQMTAAADLSALAALLPDDTTKLVMAPFLSDLNVELRADLEKEMLYLKGSIIALVAGGQSADAWYSLNVSDMATEILEVMDLSGLSQLEDASVGEALVWATKALPVDSVTDYATLSQAVSMYVEMLSDQAFTKEGSTYVAKYTLEDVLNMTITLTEQGEDIVSMDLLMTADAAEGTSTMTMTLKEHAALDQVTVEVDMEMKDESLNMKMHVDISCLPTDKAPEVAPPAGAQIVPME